VKPVDVPKVVYIVAIDETNTIGMIDTISMVDTISTASVIKAAGLYQ
jgi:hypothetical protein